MKRPFTILAAAFPLALGASHVSAGELQFNRPTTDRAEQTAELLTRAAYAVNDRVAQQASGKPAARISKLWVFPTSEVNTVFARYTVSFTGDGASTADSTEHLALVTLGNNGSAKLQELAGSARSTEHWSASIGNGRSSESSVFRVGSGYQPAAPHWSASIGSGRSRGGEGEAIRASTPATNVAQFSRIAPIHWTALIGNGSGVDGKTSPQLTAFGNQESVR